MRAIALMRRGNALMELRRWDEARGALDEALHDAKASGDRAILAQALLAAGVFAANRDDHERAEAFLLDALDRFHRDDAPASLQGRGWAFLNLATLYGKTGRLDLAFVTFTKAQDVLGAAEDWAGVAAAWEAQAQLRRAIQDEDRWRDVLADPVSYKADIGYMPEAPTLPEYLTPGEFLGYVGRIRNLPRDRIASRTHELLAMLDLTGKADDTIASLSKGMKAKLAFAAAIIHEPSILILDEPLIGIDPAGQHP